MTIVAFPRVRPINPDAQYCRDCALNQITIAQDILRDDLSDLREDQAELRELFHDRLADALASAYNAVKTANRLE